MMEEFQVTGEVQLDSEIHARICSGFASQSISDELTLSTIKTTYESCNYLLDPHGAVAVAAANLLQESIDEETPVVCLATAHPAKFPEITHRALAGQGNLPMQAIHSSLEAAKELPEKKLTTSLEELEQFLCRNIEKTITN